MPSGARSHGEATDLKVLERDGDCCTLRRMLKKLKHPEECFWIDRRAGVQTATCANNSTATALAGGVYAEFENLQITAMKGKTASGSV